jgi:hypothetical protein
MGLLSTVMSVVTGRGGKTQEDIFDKDSGLLAKAGGWIGNLSYTEEERAENNAELISGVQAFVVATLGENTDRSKARRQIAVDFMRFYMLMLFMCGMTYPIDPEWSLIWFNLATSLAVGGLVTSISVFFFGSHAMSKYQKDKKEGK